MSKNEPGQKYRLIVPLDIANIEGAERDQAVKVVARQADGSMLEAVTKFDAKGQGSAVLEFDRRPGSLEVAIGPADASAEEVFGLQTMTFKVAAKQWGDRSEVALQVIPIPAHYWFGWLRWCRIFVIRGRVLCPDGKPVPGATVTAYDVDMWWWWCSKDQVGSATTDANGAFEIRFRWCCGWWPWFWWSRRYWLLEPMLVKHILPVVRRALQKADPIVPALVPKREIFEQLLDMKGRTPIDRLPDLKGRALPPLAPARPLGDQPPAKRQVVDIDVNELDSLRAGLVERLPIIPELDKLRLWPWWPWQPWWDCEPDIIFRVTQNCQGQEQVVVNETCFDARWNAANPLDVTLTANELACCIDDTPQPEGNCINITHACGFAVSTIGGNLSAPPAPAGFQNPVTSPNSDLKDRPFAGTVWIGGDFGTLAGADYYEFEIFDGSWQPLPAGALAGFSRLYYGPPLPSGTPIDTYSVPFAVTEIDGHRVIESRQHFEANNGAGSWEVLAPGSRWWMNNKTVLGAWVTFDTATGLPNFDDGTYNLRVKSWRRVGDTLVDGIVLGQCGTDPEMENSLVLTLDNRLVGPASGHPDTVPSHPVGPGTVHTQTLEPDTDVISVVIRHKDNTETQVNACGTIQIVDTDQLVIRFLAHDHDGHLSRYTLTAHWGESGVMNLLGVAGHTLTAATGVFVGPDYATAVGQGAGSPSWHGGVIRYEAPASAVFTVTCCYQLQLRAHKRTIVGCADSDWGHTNTSEYSFMVSV